MLKSRKQEPETVDSCTQLLDLEVADKRKRRNSSPFLLPSRHANNDVPSKSNKDSNDNREKRDNTNRKCKSKCSCIWKRIQRFQISI